MGRVHGLQLEAGRAALEVGLRDEVLDGIQHLRASCVTIKRIQQVEVIDDVACSSEAGIQR